MSAGAVGALAAGISDVLRGLGWARSKDNPNGKWWTSTPDDYYDHALPALVKAGYPMAGHTLNLMMRLSWGNKGKRGEPGPEWIPMPVKELTERLGSNRNTISNNLRALVAAGVLEARDNAKDKRNKEYRVAVENLSKLNAKAFRETYEALSAESLSDVRQDDEADDAAVAMDAASAAAPAFDGPVVRFGARRISAIQVAQEAHLCKTCTHHFIEYAEAAAAPAPATKSAEVTTTEVKNVSAANTAVAAKQCKPNVHNSPDLPPAKRPSESSLIPQLRTELSHRFAARLASPPTDSLLRQIAAKLEDAGADVPFFLTRCDQRERQVKTWGFLLGLADDAAGAARMIQAARRGAGGEAQAEPELSTAERLRIYATEWIRHCEERNAPLDVTQLFERLNDNATILARDRDQMIAAIRHAEREAADWARIGLPEAKRRQVRMTAEKTKKDEYLLTLVWAELPVFVEASI